MHFSSFQKQNKQSKKTGRSWPRGCNKNTHTVCNIFLGVAPLPVTVGNEGLVLDFCTEKNGTFSTSTGDRRIPSPSTVPGWWLNMLNQPI